jgi:hypothetical protein
MKCIPRDISRNGISIYTHIPFQKGNSFCLTLPFKNGLDAIELEVEVLRSERNIDKEHEEFQYLIGGKFYKELSKEDFERIY